MLLACLHLLRSEPPTTSERIAARPAVFVSATACARARARRLPSHRTGVVAHTQKHAPLSGSSALHHVYGTFLVQGFCPSLAGRFSLPVRGALYHASTHAHVRARTTDDERSDVRAAWLTGRLQIGGTRSIRSPFRRPPPCDPYRHVLARRPPRKVRPFVSQTTGELVFLAVRRLGDSAPRWPAGSPAQWQRPRM